jgi:hypothetical protein
VTKNRTKEWRRTWDDSDDDFVYCDALGRQLGRAYFDQGKYWRWFYCGSMGLAESRREALLAVELAYDSRARQSR